MQQWWSDLWEGILELPLWGWGILAALILLGLWLLRGSRGQHKPWSTRMVAAGALSVSLAFLLSCIVVFRMPQGGSITLASMLPLFFFAFAYGPSPGIAAGIVYGLLQLMQGATIVHPVQFALDYIFPFAVLGLVGFVRNDRQWSLAILFACLLRFAIHTASGAIFFATYAPEGQNAWLYSAGYNASYMVPETVICVAVLLVPQVKAALLKIKAQA